MNKHWSVHMGCDDTLVRKADKSEELKNILVAVCETLQSTPGQAIPAHSTLFAKDTLGKYYTPFNLRK